MNILSILAMSFSLEAGWLPNGQIGIYPEQNTFQRYTMKLQGYTDLETKLHCSIFYIGGSVRTSFYGWNGDSFDPSKIDFKFDAGLSYKSIDIGWRHDCFHPIQPYVSQLPVPRWEGAYQEVFVKFKGQIGRKIQ